MHTLSSSSATSPVPISQGYRDRFQNLARLYSPSISGQDEVLRKLSQAHICVIGLGGVGSWVVESLARSGIRHMTLIDHDEVCVSKVILTDNSLP